MLKLAGRVAVITGGAGSMGSAQARLFARAGASVCVADTNIAGARTVAEEIREQGGLAIACELDVRVAAAWEEMVATTERRFGHVDTLCNLAGANYRVGFEEQTEEMWRAIIDTNLTAYFLGTKAVVPAMRRAGRGVILNTGSLASIMQGPGGPAYGVSKVGLLGLTRGAAATYAKDNIRCVLISPGRI